MIGEFERGPFAVPAPGPDERPAAYVFIAGGSPQSAFTLPSAAVAITPETPGTFGYSFEIKSSPGNRVLYALAGLENRSVAPARFVPWSMGVLKGVLVVGGGIPTEDVAIHMRHPLEHALAVDLAPPAPGPRGPDRVLVTTSIRVGPEGWLTMPQGRVVRPLPLAGPLEVVGLPLLDGQLVGAAYEVTARAATGPGLLLPASAVAGVTTSVASVARPGDFVGVPTLLEPEFGVRWGGRRIAFEVGDGSSTIDVAVIELASPGEVVRWRIAAPGDRREVRVPDLRELGLGPPLGNLDVLVTVGRIDGLDWDRVQYRHLRTGNMDAYALDTFDAHW
jgi:hypothetical protein